MPYPLPPIFDFIYVILLYTEKVFLPKISPKIWCYGWYKRPYNNINMPNNIRSDKKWPNNKRPNKQKSLYDKRPNNKKPK